MEILNPQFLAQYGKLDTIQIIQLLQLLMIAGLIWIKLRDQGLAKKDQENHSEVFKSLLANMQQQQAQGNEREGKLAASVDTQSKESNKIARALLLIHREQKRQGGVGDDTQRILKEQHLLEMAKLDQVLVEMKYFKEKLPAESNEFKRRIDTLLGHLEIVIPKIRATNEVPKVPTPVNGTTPENVINPS